MNGEPPDGFLHPAQAMAIAHAHENLIYDIQRWKEAREKLEDAEKGGLDTICPRRSLEIAEQVLLTWAGDDDA